LLWFLHLGDLADFCDIARAEHEQKEANGNEAREKAEAGQQGSTEKVEAGFDTNDHGSVDA
jgi:hypothetical protein